MMGKCQFIKYYIRSRLPFYLLVIFNGIILILFAFLFEEAADVLYYSLTILTFVSIIMVAWDLFRSYQSYKLAYLYEEITPLSPLEFYLAQTLENARENQKNQTCLLYTSSKPGMQITVGVVTLIALLSVIGSQFKLAGLNAIINFLPLSGASLPWLIPAILLILLSLVLPDKIKSESFEME